MPDHIEPNTNPASDPAHRATPKIRVLVLASTYPRWQGDTDPGFVHELCRRLADRGFDIDVLAPRTPDALERENLDGVGVFRYPYFFRRYETLAYGGGILPKLKARPWLRALVPLLLLGQCSAAWRRLRQARYDCIHAHWILPQAFCACVANRSNGPPILVTSHGGDLFGLRSRLARALTRWTLTRSEKIAVVSHYMKSVIHSEHGIAEEKIAVLPMGVDLSAQFADARQLERLPHSIVFVGRLVEKKGVRYLIEAFKIVRETLSAATLDIVGDGPMRDELERRVLDLDLGQAVRFRGAVAQTQIPSYLGAAAVAAVPSIVDRSGDQEGLGLVTIEAMGCGCPVVASDLQAIHDVVQDGTTGLLAVPGDPADLAEKLLLLLMQPELAAKLARNARAFVVERFDWESVADNYANHIRRAAARLPK